MKRQGFISIIALIIMSVLLSMVLYLGYISKLEYLILNRSNYKTQSYYQSEGKIYLALFDEEYYLNQLYLTILDVFRTNKFEITTNKVRIDDEDLNYGDKIRDIGLSFKDEDDRKKLYIIAQSNINGVESHLISSGTIVNDLFEAGYLILSPNLIDGNYEDDLRALLKNIKENISIYNCNKPGNIYGLESKNFSKIVLARKSSNSYEIACSRDTMENPYIEVFSENEIFIIAKKMENKKLELTIEDPSNHWRPMRLSGLIYVEGDIIIADNCDFRGILILKNGRIITRPGTSLTLNGMIITDHMEDYDDFIKGNKLYLNQDMIYKYGTYLPGFLDPKLTIIKGK